MSTQTDLNIGTAVDGRAAMERWRETAREVTNRYLDLYSETVERIADAQVESARASNVPALIPLAESHAAIRREYADACVKTIRGLIVG